MTARDKAMTITNKQFIERAADLEPQWSELLKQLVQDIADDYRASDDPEDDQPGMQVTFGTNDEMSSWSYQTGDNSYTGGAYSFPHWAVISLYRDSDPAELAHDAIDQIGHCLFW